jgi:hypothetical protein
MEGDNYFNCLPTFIIDTRQKNGNELLFSIKVALGGRRMRLVEQLPVQAQPKHCRNEN